MQHGPIGCRDHFSEALLREKGIDAYFSGCLTLCLDPFEDVTRGETICFVDLPSEVVTGLRAQTQRPIREMSHYARLNYLTWEERLLKVREYLKTYQAAHCVVTTRLHCALPCLALGTPVLLLSKKWQENRFKTFFNYVHHFDIDHWEVAADGGSSSFELPDFDLETPPPNSDTWRVLREQLDRACRDFIRKSARDQSRPLVSDLLQGNASRLEARKEMVAIRSQEAEELGQKIAGHLVTEQEMAAQIETLKQNLTTFSQENDQSRLHWEAYGAALASEKQSVQQRLENTQNELAELQKEYARLQGEYGFLFEQSLSRKWLLKRIGRRTLGRAIERPVETRH